MKPLNNQRCNNGPAVAKCERLGEENCVRNQIGAIGVIATLLLGLPAQAKTNDWEVVGSGGVGQRAETEQFAVGRALGAVNALRIEAVRGALILRDIEVTFGNGRTADLMDQRRQRIDAGQSAVIDLGNRRRFVRSIRVRARASRDGRQRARLRVAIRGAGQAVRPRDYEPLEVGTVRGDNRRVRLNIGRDEGRFSVLRLQALDRAVRLRVVTVTYGNGRSQEFRVNANLAAGDISAPLSLAGRNARAVQSVEVSLRPRNDGRSARVLVLGREAALEAPVARDDGPRGRVLGARVADARDDRILVPLTQANGINRVRIRVRGGDLRVRRVTFERVRGASETVRLRERVRDGDVSSVLDVPGGRGRLDLVRLDVEPSRRRSQLRVEVIGASAGGRPRRNRDQTFSSRGRVPAERYGRPVRFRDNGSLSGFERLGESNVRGRMRTLIFNPPRSKFLHDRIVLRARRGRVGVRAMTLTFGDGSSETIRIGLALDRGAATNVIRLPKPRRLRRIVLDVEELDAGRRPLLQVFASPVEDRRQSTARRIERDGKWVMLGRQRAEIFSKDNDTFKVGREYGRFDEIRVRATKADIRLYGMKILFGNGTREDVDFFGKLRRGETSKPVRLRNRGRFIESISLQYRSSLSLRGEGRVEVWGHLTKANGAKGRERRDANDGRRLLDDILRRFSDKFGNQAR